VQHLEQHPELDAVRMRLDLARRRRELLVRPRVLLRLAVGRDVRELDVRFAMMVCSTYSSTDARPFWYRPSTSMLTCVPRGVSHSICFFSRMRGSFFLVSICTSK
jgi:hypothetical protein